VGSEYREPSASPDGQYPNISSVPSPNAASKQQGTSSGSERIEEPSYREHGINPSSQPPVEGPSFYPADLLDRQLQEEQRRNSVVQAQQKNGASPYYVQGQQPYRSVPPMPSQGPVAPVLYPQYPQYPPQAPSGQPYRSAPVVYTNPQVYQYPSNGFRQPQQAYPGYPPNGPVQQPQPSVYPGYPPQQGYYQPYSYPSYQGYPGYPPYPPYPYAWYPPRPRRNGYQLGMAIVSLVGSILAIIGGAFCGLTLLLLDFASNASKSSTLSSSAIFASAILYTALMVAGIVGGAFGVFHSAFALGLRPSRPFKLPPFWVFLGIYVVLVVVGFLVGSSSVVINNLLLAFPLIALCGILPALTFLAFALRHVRRAETHEWPTTWRRFTLALVSGATSAIFLAIIFELILTLVAVAQSGVANVSSIDNPNAPTPHDPRIVILMLVIVSVIAPIVEESFKPLAVVIMIGRIRSAAEAFILGMACGIGFDMIETTEYMGGGYTHWINVAIDRSTAGLLHGFGAGMMALGWYYVTHKDALKRRHIQIGLGCMLYAILQHAIWNGSFVLQLLPAPIGPYLENGTIPIFGYQLDAFLIVYIVFSILILCFLWFVTGKVRLQPDAPLNNNTASGGQMNPASVNVAPV
jgi:PrsW family intramembrane metalloprotease